VAIRAKKGSPQGKGEEEEATAKKTRQQLSSKRRSKVAEAVGVATVEARSSRSKKRRANSNRK
jgi:hypothetical protein